MAMTNTERTPARRYGGMTMEEWANALNGLERVGIDRTADQQAVADALTHVRDLLTTLRAKEERVGEFNWRAIGLLVHEEALAYEFRDPDHTPTYFEKVMLEDFGNVVFAKIVEMRLALPPPALTPSQEVGDGE